MRYVLFDVETTGLTSSDEVIQFACIILNEKLKVQSVYDFYCMPTTRISDGAQQVHHLTLDKLRILSKGKFFEEYFYPLKEKFGSDCTFIAYSKSWFDFRLVNQTLYRARLPAFDFGEKTLVLDDNATGYHKFDLMSAIARIHGIRNGSIKLETAMERISGFDALDLKTRYNNFCKILASKGILENPEKSNLYHNARFDTFCMWYLLDKYVTNFKVSR